MACAAVVLFRCENAGGVPAPIPPRRVRARPHSVAHSDTGAGEVSSGTPCCSLAPKTIFVDRPRKAKTVRLYGQSACKILRRDDNHAAQQYRKRRRTHQHHSEGVETHFPEFAATLSVLGAHHKEQVSTSTVPPGCPHSLPHAPPRMPHSIRAPFSLQTPVERSERVAGC